MIPDTKCLAQNNLLLCLRLPLLALPKSGAFGKVCYMEKHLLLPQMTASLYLGRDTVRPRPHPILLSPGVRGIGGTCVRHARHRPIHRAAHSGSRANEGPFGAGQRRPRTCPLSSRRDTCRPDTAVALVGLATPALPL
jgi:hypothetical protein